MNLNGKTRKELVLDHLRKHRNEWVPGIDLMNQYVGGLRAGARIYELRKEGYTIERRTSATSDVDEYRLVSETMTASIKGTIVASHQEGDVMVVDEVRLTSASFYPPGTLIISRPYVKWKHNAGAYQQAEFNGWRLFIHELWDGTCKWAARKDGVVRSGDAMTTDEAKVLAETAAMEP